jgi:glycerophosphoryl diester phosphodiesterase
VIEIIAHRGASFDAPENSLTAFRLAFEQEADGVETDVRLTSDEQLVLFHDETANRMGHKKISIRRATLEQLKQIEIGHKFKIKEQIPTLTEALKMIPANKKVLLEIKDGPRCISFLPPILSNCVVASFNLQILKECKISKPLLTTYWIHDLLRFDDYALNWIIQKAQEWNICGFFLLESSITEIVVNKVKEAGLRIYAWTVNSPPTAEKLERWGVDGIITDRPGWLRMELCNLSS